nr:MAG TPA: hypothetical protein [Caudoviricetes sp.]
MSALSSRRACVSLPKRTPARPGFYVRVLPDSAPIMR